MARGRTRMIKGCSDAGKRLAKARRTKKGKVSVEGSKSGRYLQGCKAKKLLR